LVDGNLMPSRTAASKTSRVISCRTAEYPTPVSTVDKPQAEGVLLSRIGQKPKGVRARRWM